MKFNASVFFLVLGLLLPKLHAKYSQVDKGGVNRRTTNLENRAGGLHERVKRNNPLRFGLGILRPKQLASETSSTPSFQPLISENNSQSESRHEMGSNLTITLEKQSLLDNVRPGLNPLEFAMKMKKLEVNITKNYTEQTTFKSQKGGDDKIFHAPTKVKSKLESVQTFDPVEKSVKKVHYVDDDHAFYPLTGSLNTEQTLEDQTRDIEDKSKQSLTGIVIGAIVCCVVMVFLIMVIMTCTCNRKKAKEYKQMLIEGALGETNDEKLKSDLPFKSEEKIDKLDGDYGIITDRPLEITNESDLYSIIEKAGIYETIKSEKQELVEIICDLNKNLTNSLDRKSEYNINHHITSTI